MDTQTSSVLGIVAIVVSVGTTLVGIINHKKLRSKCCSKTVEVAIDIESTRPASIVPQHSPIPAKVPELVIRQNEKV
jgi:hypothetical protein